MKHVTIKAIRQRKWFIAICLIAIGVLLAGYFAGPSQPRFQGKTLDSWLQFVNDTGTTDPGTAPPTLAPFYEALDMMGTNSLPFLLDYAMQTDSPSKMKMSRFFKEHHLGWMPLHFSEERRGPTLLALMHLGVKARPIIPQCIQFFEHQPNVALMPLLVLKQEAQGAFTLLCESTNRDVRSVAAFGLVKVRDGISYHQSWEPGTYRTNRVYVWACTFGTEEMERLAANLSHSNVFLRRASAEALGDHVAIARSTLPALRRSLEDASPLVRAAAKDSIKQIESYR
jgi:hypothetical protein